MMIAAPLVAEPEQEVRTLAELFHLAEVSNPSIASKKSSLQASSEKTHQAFAAFLPSISYNGSKVSNINGSRRDDTIATEHATNYKHEIALIQPVYSRQNSIQYRISNRQIQKQHYELSQLILELKNKVAQSYFAILAQEDTLRLLGAQRITFGQQLALAKRSYEMGITTVTDVHEAQAKLDALTAQELAATRELEEARIGIRVAVGRNFQIAKGFKLNFEESLRTLPDLSRLIDQAYAGNFQIRALNTASELAQLDIKKANARHYPSIDFKISTASSRQYLVSDFPTQVDSRNTQAGVYLTIPLYSGGAISSQAREAVQNYVKSALDIESAKLNVHEEIERNHTKWRLGVTQINALEKAISSSEAALRSVITGYTLGVRTSLDIFTAQQQIIQLKKDTLKVKYDTLMSIIKINATLGRIDFDFN